MYMHVKALLRGNSVTMCVNHVHFIFTSIYICVSLSKDSIFILSQFMNLMTFTCCYLAFSLLFSTHKYILTGDFSCLGLNRFITSGVILFIGINEDYIEA